MKKSFLALLGISCLLVAGCGDGSDPALTVPPPAAQPGPSAAENPVAPPVPPPPSVAAPAAPDAPVGTTPASDAGKNVPGVLEGANAFSAPDLINLNNAYQAFRSVEMRSPKDLNELVTSGQIQSIPPAPGGKKFVIDEPNLRIILVNQ